MGELTSGSHPVKVSNVLIGTNKKKLLFILESSKTHAEYSMPQTIKITSTTKTDEDNVNKEENKDAKIYKNERINIWISQISVLFNYSEISSRCDRDMSPNRSHFLYLAIEVQSSPSI